MRVRILDIPDRQSGWGNQPKTSGWRNVNRANNNAVEILRRIILLEKAQKGENVNNSNPPFKYQWSNGTGNNAMPTIPPTYRVGVTDSYKLQAVPSDKIEPSEYAKDLGNSHKNDSTYSYIGRRYDNTMDDKKNFVIKSYEDWYHILMENNYSHEDALRLAKILAVQDAKESFYGNNKVAFETNNWGGMNDPVTARKMGRKFYPIKYDSPEDYYKAKLNMLNEKWPNWDEATDIGEYIDYINPSYGQQYAPPDDNPNYKQDISNMKSAQRWLNEYTKTFQNK